MSWVYEPELTLLTPRVRLRPLTVDDDQAIFRRIAHDREVLNYFIMDYAEDEARFSMARSIEICNKSRKHILALESRESGEVMGMLLMCSAPDPVFNGCELGLALGREYQRQGFGSEATRAFMDYLFRMGVHKVWAGCISENEASRRTLEKCGMRFEGVRKDEIFYRGRYWDECVYYRLETDE